MLRNSSSLGTIKNIFRSLIVTLGNIRKIKERRNTLGIPKRSLETLGVMSNMGLDILELSFQVIARLMMSVISGIKVRFLLLRIIGTTWLLLPLWNMKGRRRIERSRT